jgi:5-methylcytosine-specific restriction endonuclease McrA
MYKKKSRCTYCHSKENLTIDHKHPKSLGGTDKESNLQTLCRTCNEIKSGIPHLTFKRILNHGVYCFMSKHQAKTNKERTKQ